MPFLANASPKFLECGPACLKNLLSDRTVQPGNTYSSTLITATASVHLPKPVSTDLTMKSDSVLTNPIGKDGMRRWYM